MDANLKEWRDYNGIVKLQIKGDGSEVRAIKISPGNTTRAPQYYNYKIRKDNFGRRLIIVVPERKAMTLYVDELVATCFCDSSLEHKYIGHKDGDIANDSYDNLEWTDWNTYLYKYHRNKIKRYDGETFAWWKNNWYISEIGHLLIDGELYDENNIYTNIDDYDVGFRISTHAFVPYDDYEYIYIEEGVKAVWNKVIIHIDGDYGNWQKTNLKIVEPNAPEAQDLEKLWAEWKKKEDIRLFQERFPNDPIPSFIK